MESDLLNCSICPKRPTFSDSSHLLTHISSKSHLAFLHKLQVRSHQEIAAGVQLASYNEWYERHGLGQLLSERMLLKEAKSAGRRAAAAKRGAVVKQPASNSTAMTTDPSWRAGSVRAFGHKRRPRAKEHNPLLNDGGSDREFTPVRRRGYHKQRSPTASPLKRTQSSEEIYTETDCPAESESCLPATPEHCKLKGTIWPGMAMFDAAGEEMRRKRNQKKDGSVLRKMERLSNMVVPSEVVYSVDGDILKERHIDDLEDDSNLIEGETPVPKSKQSQNRKRRTLNQKDFNGPHIVAGQAAKVRLPKSHPSRTSDTSHYLAGVPPLPHLPSSSTRGSYGLTSQYVPTEESEEIGPTIRSLSVQKHPRPFVIYNDGSPRYGERTRAEARNPLHGSNQVFHNAGRSQLQVLVTPWLQPQYQTPVEFSSPNQVYRSTLHEYQSFYDRDPNKENVTPHNGHLPSTSRDAGINPLAFKSPVRDVQSLNFPPEPAFNGFFGFFSSASPGDDPFITAKNPLAEALSQYRNGASTLRSVQGSPMGHVSEDETETRLRMSLAAGA